MKSIPFVFALFITTIGFSQETSEDSLPYYEIPEYSEEFTAGTMAARMVDALGFRFYWATDSLTEKDLAYKANEDGRSAEETIEHIYNLSKVIVNSTLKKPNTKVDEDLSYEELRAQTLNNLKTAADILRSSDDISQYKIIFGEQEIPFWNQVNGPIADAIWHCGQIVIYRRTTGNPINPKVNHFSGKVKN
ncbi:hypothetical protein [Winogradskyella pulchriflava]|uniref:DinB family protein n=1 Tax=Winogradskyella pulchriflava TaxID=1110688 RepID=A0ABV6QAM4_9FLAO